MDTTMEAYKTVFQGGVGEITIKKSRFIANVSPVETEQEALDTIETLKKNFWDASHNCYAYIIGRKQQLMRCSDDGEPSKTAGWPMLEVIKNQELTNIVVVVTRYFGGTLLGTGGLVKAYQSATIEGLNNSILITKQPGSHLQITADYNLVGKIEYYIRQKMYPILSTDYTDIVQLHVLVPINREEISITDLTELSRGLVKIEKKEKVYYSSINDVVHLFR